jgi:hypothetical protein
MSAYLRMQIPTTTKHSDEMLTPNRGQFDAAIGEAGFGRRLMSFQ